MSLSGSTNTSRPDTIATGDQVVIYNAGNGYAVAGEMLGSYYLKPAAATVAENALTADSFDKLVWTVTKNEDGTYSFKQGTDTTLTMGTNNGQVQPEPDRGRRGKVGR